MLIIPYWFYLASDNKCVGVCEFKSEKLPLKSNILSDSVEDHLSRYVEENLETCIDDFKSIKELGFDVLDEGKPDAKAIIAENNIVIRLEYPLIVSRRGARKELNNFYTTLNLDLADIYSMAEYISELEEKYRFLEKNALNLIVGFSGRDSSKLPPMSDSSFEVSSKVKWRKSSVKNTVENLLVSYVPLLRVIDTLNWQEINTDTRYKDSIYNYGMSIPNNVSINHLAVYFNYLDFWDSYFDLNCNGDICAPESAFSDMLPIGLQRYNFAYDLSFPVLVEIEDPGAFNNQGYSFSFMLESNIRNNRVMPALFQPIVVENERGTMLCDETKRTSGEVDISVVNSFDKTNIDGVEMIYTCIDSCYIGDTENGQLTTSLPVCFGGVLSFRKDGFETKFVKYDAYAGKEGELEVSINPEKELEVEVIKKILIKDKDGWKLSNRREELTLTDYAAVTFTKKSIDTTGDFDIIEVKQGSNEQVSVSEGLYEIEINLIAEEGYYVPPQAIGVSGDKVHIEAINISSFISGMTTINYTFTKDDMAKNKLTLYVLSADLTGIPISDRSITDLDVTSRFSDYTKKYYYELIPDLE